MSDLLCAAGHGGDRATAPNFAVYAALEFRRGRVPEDVVLDPEQFAMASQRLARELRDAPDVLCAVGGRRGLYKTRRRTMLALLEPFRPEAPATWLDARDAVARVADPEVRATATTYLADARPAIAIGLAPEDLTPHAARRSMRYPRRASRARRSGRPTPCPSPIFTRCSPSSPAGSSG